MVNMTKLCLSLLFITLGFSSIRPADASHVEAPKIPIEQALALAKRYVSSEKIDVSESYIALAQWHPTSGSVSFWRIEWRTKKLIKGGHIVVTVYADGKIQQGFGE